jgi:hypothetical protein
MATTVDARRCSLGRGVQGARTPHDAAEVRRLLAQLAATPLTARGDLSRDRSRRSYRATTRGMAVLVGCPVLWVGAAVVSRIEKALPLGPRLDDARRRERRRLAVTVAEEMLGVRVDRNRVVSRCPRCGGRELSRLGARPARLGVSLVRRRSPPTCVGPHRAGGLLPGARPLASPGANTPAASGPGPGSDRQPWANPSHAVDPRGGERGAR